MSCSWLSCHYETLVGLHLGHYGTPCAYIACYCGCSQLCARKVVPTLRTGRAGRSRQRWLLHEGCSSLSTHSQHHQRLQGSDHSRLIWSDRGTQHAILECWYWGPYTLLLGPLVTDADAGINTACCGRRIDQYCCQPRPGRPMRS
jgi:hypothetical protein